MSPSVHPSRRTRADEERFRDVFDANLNGVRRYAARVVAPSDIDDVVADTFLVAWRRLHDMPPRPRAWLLAVARRSAANRRRGTERQQAVADRVATTLAPATDDGEPGRTSIMEAFAQLAPSDQETLALVSWEDLNAREAAEVVGCSHATFRVRLHRARKRLEDRIDAGELLVEPARAVLAAPTPNQEHS